MIWSIENRKALYNLYLLLAPQASPVELELKFQAPAPQYKTFCLHLHSPGSNRYICYEVFH